MKVLPISIHGYSNKPKKRHKEPAALWVLWTLRSDPLGLPSKTGSHVEKKLRVEEKWAGQGGLPEMKKYKNLDVSQGQTKPGNLIFSFYGFGKTKFT